MCNIVNYIYKCNHTHRATEPCRNAAAGYACSHKPQEQHLALSDTCATCAPAYARWLALQAGNEKVKRSKEQDESRKLNEWYRATLFEATGN